MRFVVAGILSLVMLSCRDIQPISPLVSITGYRFNGILTTSSGAPVPGAAVRLYYSYEYADFGPIDTIQVVVMDSTKAVDVSVYSSKNIFIRTLFFGFHRPGIVPRFRWDGLDQNNIHVPSGKYSIGYQIGDSLVKFSTVIIDGQVTTTTDALGQFTITNDYLPVGDIFDSYNSDGSYYTTFRVSSGITLEFQKQGLRSVYSGIRLTKNKTTSGVFSL